ncbi:MULTISPECIES: hypothetical protein [unclassified Yoonia]|uniref:hypothetical protein n=1 Tax=unclassified Yoonia TaxID=2629118 RepID=UPI002AFE45A2|nr:MULTISPECIES: hypothetical protein [unclassified Yoonia]
MTLRSVEVVAVVFASLVAAVASVVGILTLWEIKEQSANSEKQLAQIEEQSEFLRRQLGINEELISNDSAITFLQLLETMRPEFDLGTLETGTYETAVGGQDGFEGYNTDTLIVRFDLENNGRLPLVLSGLNVARMASCITGLFVDVVEDGEVNVESLEARLRNRVSTVAPGQTDTITFFKDTVETPQLAEAIRGIGGEFLLEFKLLLYAEGAETVGAYLDDSDDLEPYFQVIQVDDEETRAPFLSKTITLQSWVVSDGSNVRHLETTENCSWDQLNERRARSGN